MKRPQFATNFSVGFVLFVATVVVIGSLFVVGDGQNFFADHVDFQVRLPNAGGLKIGSRVLLGGVQAGSVKRIEFPEDLRSSEVILTFTVDKAYRERVREDSFAWIQSEGLLGDSSIYVKIGTAGEEPLGPGSTIRYKARAMLDTFAGEEIRESTTDLIKTISQVLADVSQGQGTLGQLLKNPELYSNLNAFTQSMAMLTKEVESISKELEGIIAEVRSQKGTLGQLIFSEDYAKSFSTAVREASALISSLRELVDAAKSGKGTVGKLLADSELHDAGKKALEDVSRASARIDGLLEKAEASGSVVGRLSTDGAMGDAFVQLVARLERSAGSLEKVLAAIEVGEGSVGMLVHDPSLATSLRDVFRGVSEAGLIQNAVRNVEREGREAYLRDASLARREAEEVLRLRALRRLGSGGGAGVGAGSGEGKKPEGASQGTPVPAAGPAEGVEKKP